jgi:hypothetical protein
MQSAPKNYSMNLNPISTKIGKPGSDSKGKLNQALVVALRPVISAILKSIAKNLEKKAADAIAKEAAKKAGKQLINETAKKGAGQVFSKIASVFTLVLIPFDIIKLVKDFNKNKKLLSETIRKRYNAEQTCYRNNIFDALWDIANSVLKNVLVEARSNIKGNKESQANFLKYAQEAASYKKDLLDLSKIFEDNSNV